MCLSNPSKKRSLTSDEESCSTDSFLSLKRKLAISIDSAKECLAVVAPVVVLLSQHKDNSSLKMKNEYLELLRVLSSHKLMEVFLTADYSSEDIKSEDFDDILELASASSRLLAALYLNHDGKTVCFYFNFFKCVG